ncbi:hypothetical protein GCM10029978_103810 [Actinoallomurus acanthiterrae]
MSGPSQLPSISYNWIGGDINGLSNLACTLYEYPSKSGQVVSRLDGTVNRLTGEVWAGQAANSFKASFGLDASDARWHSGVAVAVAGVVDQLAVRLATIQSILERQASQGVQAGYIKIDNTGRITPITGPNTNTSAMSKFFRDFVKSVDRGRNQARAARKSAAAQLAPHYKALIAGITKYSKPMSQDPNGLLTSDQVAKLNSDIGGLQSDYRAADGALHAHSKSHSAKNAVAGGGIGGTIGTGTGLLIGGTVGLLGGPFAEVTVPAGAAAGAGIGQGVGTVVGGVVGWLW